MSATSFLNGRVALHAGDCLDVLRALPDASLDTCVCDPPYALVSIAKRFGKEGAAPNKTPEGKSGAYARASAGFMGKTWDTGERAFAVEFWAEVYRVLKPGGHVAAFGGTRTYHRLTCAIEDAGFEVRDRLSYFMAADTHVVRFLDSLNDEQRSAFFRCLEESQFGGELAWVFGSGFPKSHDVAKGIDRVGGMSPRDQSALLRARREAAGLSREDVAAEVGCTPSSVRDWEEGRARAAGAAIEWIVPSPGYRAMLAVLLGYSADERRLVGVAADRRDDGTVYGIGHTGEMRSGGHSEAAAVWEGWGSALKPALEPICLARKPLDGTIAENVLAHGTGALNIAACRVATPDELRAGAGVLWSHQRKGEASAERRYTTEGSTNFAATPGPRGGSPDGRWPANVLHDGSPEVVAAFPEAPGQQRSVGPEHGAKSSVNVYGDYGARDQFVPRGDGGSAARFFYSAKADSDDRIGSKHPTVKPVDLMRWLVRLVTPPGGTVLDPFAGTGTTGEAAFREGFSAVLVEREAEYRADIARRMELVLAGPDGRKHAIAKAKAKPDDMAGTLFAPRLTAAE